MCETTEVSLCVRGGYVCVRGDGDGGACVYEYYVLVYSVFMSIDKNDNYVLDV